jgi:hypothetical protein
MPSNNAEALAAGLKLCKNTDKCRDADRKLAQHQQNDEGPVSMFQLTHGIRSQHEDQNRRRLFRQSESLES